MVEKAVGSRVHHQFRRTDRRTTGTNDPVRPSPDGDVCLDCYHYWLLLSTS